MPEGNAACRVQRWWRALYAWLCWTTLGRVCQWSSRWEESSVYGALRRFSNGFNGSYELPRLPLHSLPQAFVHQTLHCLQMVFRAFWTCLVTGPLLPPRAVTTGTSYSLPTYVVHSRMLERMDWDHKGCAKLVHLISWTTTRKFDRLEEIHAQFGYVSCPNKNITLMWSFPNEGCLNSKNMYRYISPTCEK